MSRPIGKFFVLSPGTSRSVKSASVYVAHFRDPLDPNGEVARRIGAFAARLGAGAKLVPGGAPFFSSSCAVTFDALTPNEVSQFEAEFRPDKAVVIPEL